MDDFGLITIDNKNLLNDLLELDGKHDFDDQYDLLYSNNNNNITSNNNQSQYLPNKFQSNYIQPISQPKSLAQQPLQQQQQQQNQGRKFYLESPTFAKGEDDIYRFVHSRISVLDQDHEDELNDSLENETNLNTNNNNNNININNNNNNKDSLRKNTSNNNLNNNNTNNIQRIGSNKLLSDLAVASLSKRQTNNSTKSFKPSIEEPIYHRNLADSLDDKPAYINSNNNLIPNNQFINNNNNQQLFNSNQSSNNNNNNIIQPQLQQQYILNQSPTHQQQQGLIPYPSNIQPLFVLPSPTSSFQYQQPQFIPIPVGPPPPQTQQANMYYPEPLQPLFYNTAYPLNTYPPANNYYNNNQPNEYLNDPYQQQYQQPDLYNRSILQQQQQQQFQQQQQQHQQRQNNPNYGTKYDAQPLQPPPIPQPRNLANNNNNNYSQYSNESYEQDSPQDDLEENDNQINDEDEDMKRQQVWNKLRKANKEVKDKHSGVKKAPSSIPNSNYGNNSSSNKSNTNSSSKKPPKPESSIKKPENNYLEKNIEAIKNKENLTHRYPEKKYEVVHGKNLSQRFKNTDTNKKPPHHLQPLDNQYQDDNEDDLNNKTITVNLTNPNDPYDPAQKISIPIEASALKNALKDKDHINLDINLRLIDFMPTSNNQRSMDDFDVNPSNRNYVRNNYETNISRSLPGSSGSLNKLKPLPPLKKNAGNSINHFKAYSSSYDNYEGYEDGYLAQLQKSHVKPVIKTYTIKDYRNFKKDAIPASTNSTGKLGFDYESDHYKQKVEIAQRKGDYAERVKARNRIILAEQKRNEDAESKANSQSEPSKLQRAKEYVKAVGLLRQNSAPRNEDETTSQTSGNIKQQQQQNRTKQQLTPIQQRPTPTRQLPQGTRQQQPPNRSQPSELTNREEKPSQDTTIVRIRDPITSKVKKIYLNDKDIELLSHRHEEDKNKVNKIFNNNEDINSTRRANLNKVPSETKTFENNNNNNYNNNNMNANITNNRKPIDLNRDNDSNDNNLFKQTIDNYEIALDKRNNDNNKVGLSLNKTSNSNNNNHHDNDFDQLLERHNQEKKLVNEFANF